LKKTTHLQGQGPSVVSPMTYQENKAIREVGLSKVKSILHCETNQHRGFLTFLRSMKVHLVLHVSLLESYHVSTIPGRIHDPPPPIHNDGEHEYEVEDMLDSRIFNRQF
jgi:hypothetical protein